MIEMVAPLVMAGLGGLALSGGANLYAQHNSRKLYSRELDAYRRLDVGYGRYLAKHGLRYNPARRFAQGYGSRIAGAETNIQNSYSGSIGTAGGIFRAGSRMSGWL